MEETMKAVAALEQGKVGIVEIPKPVPGDYECLTKIQYCGICNGTDLKLIHNKVTDKQIPYPTILGHESVGTIVAVGSKVRNWKVGDRVVSPIGTIDPASGYQSNYGQMAEYGITHDIQAMMEDGIPLGKQPPIPDYRGKLIPKDLSMRDAVMLLTFKENYSSLTNFGFQSGMDLLVIGDGPVAMGIACIARARGAGKIAILGHHDDRLAHISKNIAIDYAINTGKQDALEALNGQQFDMIIDAVGALAAAVKLSHSLRPGGMLGMYGVMSYDKANLNLFDMPNHISLHMLNWPVGEHRAHPEVCELVEKGILVPSQYYSHVLPMEDAAKGFAMVENREAFKVILQMPGATEE